MRTTLNAKFFFKHQLPQSVKFFCLGYGSSVTLVLTHGSLIVWMMENKIDLSSIGFWSWVTFPYCIKFLWGLVIDYYKFLIIRRKEFLYCILQVFNMCLLITLSFFNPDNIKFFFIICIFSCLFSSIQDVIIDSIRLQTVEKSNIAKIASFESIGFKLGLILCGAGVLYMAEYSSWKYSYILFSLSCMVGSLCMIFIPSSTNEIKSNNNSAFFANVWELVWRKEMWAFIAFVFLFKFSISSLTVLTSSFLLKMSFSKVEIASISKIFGVGMMIFGSYLGGILISDFNKRKIAIICFILQCISCLLFFSYVNKTSFIYLIVGFECFTSGICNTLIISIISFFCKKEMPATEYSFIYSFCSLSKIISLNIAGVVVDTWGWQPLFLFLILPPLLSILTLMTWKKIKAIA